MTRTLIASALISTLLASQAIAFGGSPVPPSLWWPQSTVGQDVEVSTKGN